MSEKPTKPRIQKGEEEYLARFFPTETARKLARLSFTNPLDLVTSEIARQLAKAEADGFRRGRDLAVKYLEDENGCRHVEHAQFYCSCWKKAEALRKLEPSDE